jgi:phytoene dehydrogenase-like protein
MLEAADEIGGATASVKAFKEYEARLSRYSYLVALLPDQIIKDLGLNFETLSRDVSSFTPYEKDGKDYGLHISRIWDQETEESFKELTGSDHEGIAWQEFYSDVEKVAQKMAPTFLEPLRTRSEMKALIGQDKTWDYLVENPMSKIIKTKFKNDLVRGVVLTDALIGTFVSADSIQSNICFLYHLVGNGTGEWKVPRGGMGALVKELERVATSLGVQIKTVSEITQITSTADGVTVRTTSGHSYEAVTKDLQAWWPKMRPGAMFGGDDYTKGYPGVQQAVWDFFGPRDIKVRRAGRCWLVTKPTATEQTDLNTT